MGYFTKEVQTSFLGEDTRDVFKEAGYAYQSENYLCGPTAIQNLQAFLGLPKTPIDELVRLCETEKNKGTTRQGVAKALKALGISHQEGVPFSRSSDEVSTVPEELSVKVLEEALDSGSVCVINFFNSLNNTGHFTILVRHDERRFHFIDSSLGLFSLRKDKFLERWHDQKKTEFGWYAAIPIEQKTGKLGE